MTSYYLEEDMSSIKLLSKVQVQEMLKTPNVTVCRGTWTSFDGIKHDGLIISDCTNIQTMPDSVTSYFAEIIGYKLVAVDTRNHYEPMFSRLMPLAKRKKHNTGNTLVDSIFDNCVDNYDLYTEDECGHRRVNWINNFSDLCYSTEVTNGQNKL